MTERKLKIAEAQDVAFASAPRTGPGPTTDPVRGTTEPDFPDFIEPSNTVRVWDVSVRVFHWTTVTCVIIAWFTAGVSANYHELAGYIVIALLLFRIWWGFAGTQYARFSTFFPTPRKFFGYLIDVIRGRSPRHLGHNPVGAAMIFALLGLLAAISITGWMMLTRQFFGVAWVETTHKYTVYALLSIIPVHVAGALLSSLLHKENLIGSMFSGQKPIQQGTYSYGVIQPVIMSAYDQLIDRLRAVEAFSVMTALSIGATAVWYVAVPIVDRQPTTDKALQQSSPKPAQTTDRRDYIFGVPNSPSFTWMLASGGRLYDSWFAALKKNPPPGRHPAWPASNKKLADIETWRCKNCHGWDYKGNFGEYRRGKHRTGISGIRGNQGDNPRSIMRILRQREHGFTKKLIPDDALYRIALFISNGQHATERYIRPNGTVRGSRKKGKVIFQNLCAICHGFDGKARNLGNAAAPAFVGTKAQANPWEVLHKIRNGFPGKQMVALRAFRMRDAVNVLAYARTLPEK